MVRPYTGLTSLAHLATATWLATLAGLAQAAWNPNHPHRSILERAVTSDVSSVSGKSFDFVIAGGGLAGLAVAARLSEWDNVTVLVVEAGGDGSDVADQIDIPGASPLLPPTTATTTTIPCLLSDLRSSLSSRSPRIFDPRC